jgi:hypothetical protein
VEEPLPSWRPGGSQIGSSDQAGEPPATPENQQQGDHPGANATVRTTASTRNTTDLPTMTATGTMCLIKTRTLRTV